MFTQDRATVEQLCVCEWVSVCVSVSVCVCIDGFTVGCKTCKSLLNSVQSLSVLYDRKPVCHLKTSKSTVVWAELFRTEEAPAGGAVTTFSRKILKMNQTKVTQNDFVLHSVH